MFDRDDEGVGEETADTPQARRYKHTGLSDIQVHNPLN